MKLVKLAEYRSKGVINALEELLALAHAGELKGVAVVAKFSKEDHRAYTAGDYKHHPAEALSATFMLERQIEKKLAVGTGFRESL